jgi:hypothetical protein
MPTDKTELRELVLSALRSRDLESAHAYAQQLKDIEAREHPEWHHPPFGVMRSVDHLKLILSCKTQILESVSDEVLEHLRYAAGVASLLGVTRFRDYLPSGFKTGLAMDNDSAVRMLLFRASHECDLAYARLAKAEKVWLMAVNWAANFFGVCDYCKALHGQEWKLEEAPEFPLKRCTSETGCRCMVVPVLPTDDKARWDFGFAFYLL